MKQCWPDLWTNFVWTIFPINNLMNEWSFHEQQQFSKKRCTFKNMHDSDTELLGRGRGYANACRVSTQNFNSVFHRWWRVKPPIFYLLRTLFIGCLENATERAFKHTHVSGNTPNPWWRRRESGILTGRSCRFSVKYIKYIMRSLGLCQPTKLPLYLKYNLCVLNWKFQLYM